jgi:hypothetical protein
MDFAYRSIELRFSGSTQTTFTGYDLSVIAIRWFVQAFGMKSRLKTQVSKVKMTGIRKGVCYMAYVPPVSYLHLL